MQGNFEIKAAKAISYLFNPLIIPCVGIILIFNSGTYLSFMPQEGKNLILSIVFTGTFIVPLCFVPLYMYLKIIKSIEIEDKSQRVIPYIITFFAYCCTFYLIKRIPIPIINSYIISICIALLINILILIKWKISTHLIAAGGLAGLIFGLIFRLNADLTVYFIISVIFSGVLATSRLILQSHKPKEIYYGFFTGFAVVAIFIIFL